MSSNRRYTSSGNRSSGRDRSRQVTDLRSRRDDESSGSPQHARILEDSIVDACCDHAHAVARVHGAQEVMLEHLIHALARVPEAAQVLEEQGYDVDHIRRESAAVIASDIPVGKHDPKRELYASNDFNTVLHLAAANASRQGEAEISIWELLDAISSYDDALPSIRLLNEGHGRKRDYPRRDVQSARVRGGFDRDSRGREISSDRDHAPALEIRADASSDELLQQGLAAIETALQRQNESDTRSDPRLEEKLGELDARITALMDHRAQEMKELVETLKTRDDSERTRAVHADLIALRETIDKRDNEMREISSQLERRVDALKDDVGLIISDPQTGLRDEIHALSERIDGAGSGDLSKLSTSMEQRLVSMETLVDTRQGEILGLHSALGKGVDEQGVRLRNLEARLKGEHDQTQNELRAIRGFVEKIATTVERYAGEIDRLRLDHIGDMSVISNQLDDLSSQMNAINSRIQRSQKSRGTAFGNDVAGKGRPSRFRLNRRKFSDGSMGVGVASTGRPHDARGRVIASNISGRSFYDARDERNRVIDIEETTQRVAQRFATNITDNVRSDSNRGPRGSMDYAHKDQNVDNNSRSFSGQRGSRSRSVASQAKKGQSLRERLVARGSQLKDQYETRSRDPGNPKGSTDKPGWGRRFWDDVKGLFRDDDQRWTDWRK